ncbi:MAG: uncharacterized protein KVP18_000286 [Porospora cf. gigantea A]|uniref:uncharacterized protein n=1 Tax=Porospora cf. gigantea A TaxID=2853593 RepID=UPI00355A2017|nr:MAG: hypothetical protein KVP18_000286 [Porospora cf. gigantea A]
MHLIKTKNQSTLYVSLAVTLVGPSQLRLAEGASEEAETLAQQAAQNVSHYIQDTVTQMLGNGSSQPTGMTLPGNGTTFAPLSNGTTFALNNCTTAVPTDDGVLEFTVGGILLAAIILVLLIGGAHTLHKGRRRQQDNELASSSYTRLP